MGSRLVAPNGAGLCVSAIQGALIQARVERSGVPIEMAANELASMLWELAARGDGVCAPRRRSRPARVPD